MITDKSTEFKSLPQVCNIGLGGTPSRKHLEFWNGNIDWMNSGEITGNPVVQKSTEKITQAAVDNSSTKLGKTGDTVISIIDPNEDKISILAKPMYYNQSVICLSPYDNIDRGCIFFGIRKAMKTLKTLKNGAAQQSLNKEKFISASIPYGNSNELYQIIMRIINLSDNIEKLNELKQLYLKKFFG